MTQIPSTVVLGNEACDLDSVACTYAFSEYLALDAKNKKIKTAAIYPVLNIPKNELRLRNDVLFALKEAGIDTEQTFRFRDTFENTISKMDNGEMRLFLVDHNKLAPTQEKHKYNIVGVIDHHMDTVPDVVKDRACILQSGSCASLLVLFIFDHVDWNTFDISVPKMLYMAIMLDTSNMTRKMASYDKDAATVLESHLTKKIQQFGEWREKTYKELRAKRCNVSNFSVEDLLASDFKSFKAADSGFRYGISVVRCPWTGLWEQFVMRKIKNFMAERGIEGLVISFSFVDKNDETVTQLGYIGPSYPLNELRYTPNVLELKFFISYTIPDVSHPFYVFKQKNVECSRKQIKPVMDELFAKCEMSVVK